MGNPTTNAKKKIMDGFISWVICFSVAVVCPTALIASDAFGEDAVEGTESSATPLGQDDGQDTTGIASVGSAEDDAKYKAQLTKEKKAYKKLYKKVTAKKYRSYLSKANKKALKKDLKSVKAASDVEVVRNAKQKAEKIFVKVKLRKAKAAFKTVASKVNSSEYSWLLTSKQFKNMKKYAKQAKKATGVGEVQALTKKAKKILKVVKKTKESAKYKMAKNHLTRSNGTVWFNGHRETWYSCNEGYANAYHGYCKFDSNGIGRDQNGYVIVASPGGRNRGSIVATSVGLGIVRDACGTSAYDIYTNW